MSAVWTTKDGAVLNISDMKTSHIENCISLLDKASNDISYAIDCTPEISYLHIKEGESQLEAIDKKMEQFGDELEKRNKQKGD